MNGTHESERLVDIYIDAKILAVNDIIIIIGNVFDVAIANERANALRHVPRVASACKIENHCIIRVMFYDGAKVNKKVT